MRIRYRLSVALAIALAVTGVLSGCGSTVGGATGGGGGEAAGDGGGATFVYATYEPVIQDGWDPSTFYSTEGLMMPNIYETLTHYDAAGEKVEPLLATKWTSADGGKEWTFDLRKANFHDGRPLTSEAVKEAILRTKKLGGGAAYEWEPVEKILTPNPRTVVFKLNKSTPLDVVASSQTGAAIYDVKASGSENLHKWFEKGNDAGTGPYTVEQWQPGQEAEVRLKKFPGYWGGWTPGQYESVLYRVIPEGGTAADLLQAGQVSFVESLNPQLIQSLEGDSNIEVTSTPANENVFLMLNTKQEPLDQVGVRQALAWAYNYDDLLQVLKGGVERTAGILPPGIPGHVEAGELPEYEHDEEKAEELLSAAGYGPGKKTLKLTLTYQTGEPIEQAVASIAKSSWAPLGVEVETTPLQFPTLLAKTQGPEDQRQSVATYEWFPDYADPLNWFENLFETQDPIGFNASYYSNPKLDKMIERASVLFGADPEGAEAEVKRMQKLVLEDVPAIPVADLVFQRALLSSVEGYEDDPAYTNTVFVYDLRQGA